MKGILVGLLATLVAVALIVGVFLLLDRSAQAQPAEQGRVTLISTQSFDTLQYAVLISYKDSTGASTCYLMLQARQGTSSQKVNC